MNLIDITIKSVPVFLQSLYNGNGFFKWSLSNDLYSEQVKWGLGNSVFAVKIYTIMNLLSQLENTNKKEISNFILSFETPQGGFKDPLVHKKTRLLNKLVAIKHLNFSNFFGQKVLLAETRQVLAALSFLNQQPKTPFKKTTETLVDFKAYYNGLDWKNFWGATSHMGHQVFFLRVIPVLFPDISFKNSSSILDFAFEKISEMHKPDGLWYLNDTSPKQKINGAMKIISSLRLLNKKPEKADKLIDFILKNSPLQYGDCACDFLNAIFVLKYAFDAVDKNYRSTDVRNLCEALLTYIQKHFFFDSLGFSFHKGVYQRRYYGFYVTSPYEGPDIHGTFLFTWAIAFIDHILELTGRFNPDIIN